MIVVDTNVIVHLLVRSPKTEIAEQVFGIDPAWCAPMLWRSEFRNALSLQIRTGNLSLPLALDAFETAETILEDNVAAAAPVLALSADSGCTGYDCEFVAVAQHASIPLVTDDRQLLDGFPDVATSPRAFVSA